MTQLGALPVVGPSDGSIAFDTVGRFGYGLLAATGGSAETGGQLFVLRRSGQLTAVGSYDGPGGAENMLIAPAKFGGAAGSALLAVDQDNGIGRVLAMDAHGNVKVLADKLPFGINPIALIQAPPTRRAVGLPAPGLYLADTNSKAVWFTPAAGLKPYIGSVVVATEKPPDNSAHIWIVRPNGTGFQTVELPSDLPSPSASWNFESAAYIP